MTHLEIGSAHFSSQFCDVLGCRAAKGELGGKQEPHPSPESKRERKGMGLDGSDYLTLGF